MDRKITPEVMAELIRDVQRNEHHGDLVITFNAGNITVVKDTFTHKPDRLLDAYGDVATKRKTVFVVNRLKKEPAKTHEAQEENKAR